MKLKSRVLKCTECGEDIVDVIASTPSGLTNKPPEEIYNAVKAHFTTVHGDDPFNFSARVFSVEGISEYEPEDIGSGEDM